MATLKHAHFLFVDLRWADLRGADLRGASFAGSDLRHADFRDTDLRGARFGVVSTADGWWGCNLQYVSFDGAHFEGATFQEQVIWPDGFDPVALRAKAFSEEGSE